jgi:FtsP/CotA-like multicopper oxidase with cupredoxin domain
VPQSGTYWYHSHSAFQEQTGLYGSIVIEPRAGYAQAFDRDYVVLLSDWSDETPETIVSNLKFQSDYYNNGSARSAPSSPMCRKRAWVPPSRTASNGAKCA